jgi:hypothetical protein
LQPEKTPGRLQLVIDCFGDAPTGGLRFMTWINLDVILAKEI